MGLLPEEASFAEQVADYFAAVRGRGLMLSALDAELVAEWSEAGVPFEVVARGIRRAAEKASYDARPDEPAVSSLRACKRQVEAEIRKYVERSAGRTQQGDERPKRSVEEERKARMRSALRKLAKCQASLAGACARLAEKVEALGAPTLEDLAALEERIYAALVRATPFARRLEILRGARDSAGPPAGMSARARKLSLRVHRAAALRRAVDLPPFW